MDIRLRRVYDPPSPQDGKRILVDGLWPRGISRQKACLEGWFRELAPSTALRRWFSHDTKRWERFKERYFAELDARPDAVARLEAAARDGPLTLLFAARDQAHSNAAALREYLTNRVRRA